MNFKQWPKRPKALVSFVIGMILLVTGIAHYGSRNPVWTILIYAGAIAASEGWLALTFNAFKLGEPCKGMLRRLIRQKHQHYRRT